MKAICFALVLLNASTYALTPAQRKDFGERVTDPNPAVRFTAMDELSGLLERSPEKAGNEVIPMFCRGLADTDAKVREYAAANLAFLAFTIGPRFAPKKPSLPDLQSYGPLKADLEKAMFDVDPKVRTPAGGAYAFTFDISSELQAKLIKQFSQEDETGRKVAIIEILTMCELPTAPTETFLTQLLDDPEMRPRVVEEFSKLPLSSKIAPPPPAALPRLVDMLGKEKNIDNRQALARVLGKYGAQARPYLTQIEALQDKESDPTTRSNLKAAADAIRAGIPLQ